MIFYRCDLSIYWPVLIIYAFVIKLREDISRELVSRECNFKMLQSLIAAAQRYESRSDLGRGKVDQELSTWQPIDANFIQSAMKKKSSSKLNYAGNSRHKTKSGQLRNTSCHTYPSVGQGSGKKSKSPGGDDPANQICFHFNRNVISACELIHNLCRNRRQHKCLTCQQWDCKQLNHPPQIVPATSQFLRAGRQSQAPVSSNFWN